jgi:hypothetical protein
MHIAIERFEAFLAITTSLSQIEMTYRTGQFMVKWI